MLKANSVQWWISRAFVAAIFCSLTIPAKSAAPWEFPTVPVTVEEVFNYNGPGQSADYARKVVVSQSGRIYLLGRGLEVGEQNYLLVRCFNADGSLRWADTRALNGFQALDLLVDANDNAFVVGRIFSNSGFPPSHDVALFKYNAEGVSARANEYALDYAEPGVTPFYNQNVPTAAAFAPNGMLYVSGYVSNETFAEPTDVSHPYIFAINPAETMSLAWTSDTHTAASFSPVFEEVPVSIAVNAASDVYELSNHGVGVKGTHLRKVTAAGANAWPDSVKIEEFGAAEHTAVAVGVDSLGNPYVVGNVIGSQGGETHPFVAQFNPANGDLVWVRTFRFGAESMASAARTLPDGSTVIVGSVDYGSEWLVFRVDSAGGLMWQQRPSHNAAQNLTVDGAGNIYVVGDGSSFPTTTAVAKLNETGQLLWFKNIPGTERLPEGETMPPTVAADANGAAYVTAHRNVATSVPDEFGATYPVYDLTLVKLFTTETAPLVRITSPAANAVVAPGAAFPTITVEASSANGIQGVAIYDARGTLRAMLTNAPYTTTLTAVDDLRLNTVHAVAYDNKGVASVASVTVKIGPSTSVVQLERATLLVWEDQTWVELVARRDSVVGHASVEGAIAAGTASAADFHAFGESAVYFNFQEGEHLAFATIEITQDTAVEGSETFTVTLDNATGAEIGPINATTVTILDDDSGIANIHGTLGFDAFNYRVSETDGAVTVRVLRSGGAEGTVSLRYFTQPNTATPSVDYLETTGELVFGPGETEKTITVRALKDELAEDAESFYITLHTAANGAELGVRYYCLVYIDNAGAQPAAPTVSFDAAMTSIPENQGNLLLVVRRNGDASGHVSVSYSFSNGTATEPSDYTASAGTLTFAPTETVKSINIPVIADSSVEGDETFFVQLSSPQGATLGIVHRAQVTILEVAATETIASWTAAVFTAEERANPAISGPGADPDGDTLPNIVEYALGLDPMAADNKAFLAPQVLMVNGQLTLQIRFNRPKGRTDIDYIFKEVGALGDEGCKTCADLIITDNGDGTENVTVRISAAGARMKFISFGIETK